MTRGAIDVLVNNAGVTEDNLILRMSREAWDRVLATNLTGAFLLTQAVVKANGAQAVRPHRERDLGRRA